MRFAHRILAAEPDNSVVKEYVHTLKSMLEEEEAEEGPLSLKLAIECLAWGINA